jgi:UDP-GlcNAc3NAcA epimerase
LIKIVTIVGARPQFIKAATISRELRNEHADNVEEVIVHTGQHFDENMSKVFFDDLDIPAPKYNLEISGGGHGEMTGKMLGAVEQVLLKEKPSCLLIYGDTNSTLAGALAAAKLHIPVAHVEAGLRSFNMRMPEEVNRILSDRVSSHLFCPTVTAVENLKLEGITKGVHNVGDVMYDAALFYRERASTQSSILSDLGLSKKGYVLATCHRAENTDDINRLKPILESLAQISNDLPVVLPLHPRTRKLIDVYQLNPLLKTILITNPLSFMDMVALEQDASFIMTDSGGVQKEAYFYQVPCITMREETEWVETVNLGWNQLVGANKERIILAAKSSKQDRVNQKLDQLPYGNGNAAQQICNYVLNA